MKKSSRAYGTGLYVVMALCLAAVMTVGIISLVYDYRDVDFDFSIPEYSLPPIGDNSKAEPVDNNPSDVDPGVSEPAEVMFYKPVDGNAVKQFSPDTLVFSQTMQDYRVHGGIDLASPLGTEVLAYAEGLIESITDAPLMGTTVVISHDNGLKSYYMNLDAKASLGLTAGAEVKAGDVIGKVGKTAIVEIAEQPHLHFELTVDGELVNPADYLDAIED